MWIMYEWILLLSDSYITLIFVHMASWQFSPKNEWGSIWPSLIIVDLTGYILYYDVLVSPGTGSKCELIFSYPFEVFWGYFLPSGHGTCILALNNSQNITNRHSGCMKFRFLPQSYRFFVLEVCWRGMNR